ncbi:hypothetical protein XO12_09295 [Marinitoga sp. 1154]|uniref:BREX-1 system adenine-specific DNA-methyltransferase PglX n=1 Tax=Marinitoga sp. 1154 TaxID=1643335 RepID=UPI001586C203|nr:BREX-1 system adenine-specific DNA-methyltransferase PglX [Marinitoga sp. 1154]NUV00275.1 hypothetical protein [Marinitoga sp. 1154]
MDKNAIKKFAINARKELLEKVELKAKFYELTKDSIKNPEEQNKKIINGIPLKTEEIKARNRIIEKMNLDGYENVIEEIAYTWFNRLIAIKFMENNKYFPDFLPLDIKILSIENDIEPVIIKNPFEISDYLNLDRDEIRILAGDFNKRNELFKKIIVKLCNKLHKYMPFMFEEINDYTELLFPDNLFGKDSLLVKMSENIPDEDWKDVEIIGWLYQFYISEKKDETMSKKKAYKKEEIPFVTQLFTPDWIVKYMTENSLGKLWVEVNPETSLKEKWEYFLEEPEQNEEVKQELEKIRYKNVKPEEIKVIDPCCGSGHILTYAFDILYDIYKETGELETEIPRLILKNNLFGLDIDKRAAQLAYFSLVMKTRSKNRRFFRQNFEINISEIIESNEIVENDIELLTENMSKEEKEITINLLEKFKDAKLYGSLIEIENIDYSFILDHLTNLEKKYETNFFKKDSVNKLKELISEIIKIADILNQKYDVVITNPPYIGNKYIHKDLKKYLEKNYPDSKSDLFAVFIERNFKFLKENGFNAMITMQSWMFLSSYEKLRKKIIENYTIYSLIHLGYGAIGIEFGTSSFVVRKNKLKSYMGKYFRLFNKMSQKIRSEILSIIYKKSNKKINFRFDFDSYKEVKKEIKENGNLFKIVYSFKQINFKKIPGSPIAYWVSDKMVKSFEKEKMLGEFAEPRQGLATSDNKRFLRLWHEVDINNIGFGYSSREEAKKSGLKWFPYNKGGNFRKWYGNQEYVVNWENDGYEIRNFRDSKGKLKSRPQNMNYYFKEGITWSAISSSKPSFRYSPYGFIFDSKGPMIFSNSNMANYILGLLNSKVSLLILKILAPTIDFNPGSISKIPVFENNKISLLNKINILINENIENSKEDWDDFETSWNFKTHPFLRFKDESGKIENAYYNWEKYAEERFYKLKQNEEDLNKIFLDIYDLANEISYEVKDEDITIRKAERLRDVKSFISYAVGCMFGRYSPDKEELIFAGGKFNMNDYPNYKPDEDGILPILDDDYGFKDDIVEKFVSFVEYTFGKENLKENLEFIAKTLNEKSIDPEETLRKYFIKNFYKDHTKIYKKKPIYWMFTSGKKGAFKVLIYMHRYNENTISKIRTDYLFKIQNIYESNFKTISKYLENPVELSRSNKKKYERLHKKLSDYIDEIKEYDTKIQHYADKKIEIDLDNGVEENYKLFESILEKIK